MVPNNFPGLVIDRPKERSTGDAIVGASPSVGSMLGFEEIDAVSILRAHDQHAGFWIKAGRTVVRAAALVRRYQDAAFRGMFGWIRNGASLRIDPLRPVHGGEGRGQQI